MRIPRLEENLKDQKKLYRYFNFIILKNNQNDYKFIDVRCDNKSYADKTLVCYVSDEDKNFFIK
ncbi:hypothetical protein CQA69_02475 [Campylobacter estrildidarum]|uniref:Uncharacterized protein n=1 Tax=Campylobacter estrildidarum TaxID=2510189 RepID=A0A4U7BRJ6_9BACT|nr:hypothetical protein CQA69_02475 [Campylobacter estrildidarum]